MAACPCWSESRKAFLPYNATNAADSKTYYHKSTGVLFQVSNSGTYTEDILSGKWIPVHQDL